MSLKYLTRVLNMLLFTLFNRIRLKMAKIFMLKAVQNMPVLFLTPVNDNSNVEISVGWCQISLNKVSIN